MNLILIANPTDIEHEFEILNQLFESGLQCFHLRKPQKNKQELKHYLQQIPQEFHSRIVVHEHLDLTHDFELKGLHFNTKTISLLDTYKSVRGTKSFSAHSITEIETLQHQFDYLFLSPIFPSISKQGYEGNLNHNEISNYLKNNNLSTQIVALGGIENDKIKQCKTIGFSRFAVLGAIWNNPQIAVNQFLSLKKSL